MRFLILVDKARPNRTDVVEEVGALPPPRTPAISYVVAAGLVVIASIGCLHVGNTLSQRLSDARDVQRYIVAAASKIAPSPAFAGVTTAPAQQPRRRLSRASATRPMTRTPPAVARSTPRRAALDARPTAEPDPGAVIDWLLNSRAR